MQDMINKARENILLAFKNAFDKMSPSLQELKKGNALFANVSKENKDDILDAFRYTMTAERGKVVIMEENPKEVLPVKETKMNQIKTLIMTNKTTIIKISGTILGALMGFAVSTMATAEMSEPALEMISPEELDQPAE